MNDKISVKQEAKLEDAILFSQFLDVDSVNDWNQFSSFSFLVGLEMIKRSSNVGCAHIEQP